MHIYIYTHIYARGRKGGKEERFHFEHHLQEKYELLSWSMIPKFECMSMEVYCIIGNFTVKIFVSVANDEMEVFLS